MYSVHDKQLAEFIRKADRFTLQNNFAIPRDRIAIDPDYTVVDPSATSNSRGFNFQSPF